jgi:hypothetical protein
MYGAEPIKEDNGRSASQKFTIMESQGSLLCPEQPKNVTNPKPYESSANPSILFL